MAFGGSALLPSEWLDIQVSSRFDAGADVLEVLTFADEDDVVKEVKGLRRWLQEGDQGGVLLEVRQVAEILDYLRAQPADASQRALKNHWFSSESVVKRATAVLCFTVYSLLAAQQVTPHLEGRAGVQPRRNFVLQHGHTVGNTFPCSGRQSTSTHFYFTRLMSLTMKCTVWGPTRDSPAVDLELDAQPRSACCSKSQPPHISASRSMFMDVRLRESVCTSTGSCSRTRRHPFLLTRRASWPQCVADLRVRTHTQPQHAEDEFRANAGRLALARFRLHESAQILVHLDPALLLSTPDFFKQDCGQESDSLRPTRL